MEMRFFSILIVGAVVAPQTTLESQMSYITVTDKSAAAYIARNVARAREEREAAEFNDSALTASDAINAFVIKWKLEIACAVLGAAVAVSLF
jgi:hypothetical protein